MNLGLVYLWRLEQRHYMQKFKDKIYEHNFQKELKNKILNQRIDFITNSETMNKLRKIIKFLEEKLDIRKLAHTKGGALEDDIEFAGQTLANLSDSLQSMIFIGIENAKFHGIDLKPGIPNLANGNCAFETVCDQISTRICFSEDYNTHSPDH